MAGLFLVSTKNPEFAQATLSVAREQYARHGFPAGREVELPGWTLLHTPHIFGGPESLLVQDEDLVAIAGTFTFDGKMGRPALEALLSADALPSLDWTRIGGQFVALVRKAGRAFLFGDFFAAFQLFHDAERRFFSTSLLAAAQSLPRLHFSAQGVYELVFNVMPLGDETVFEELRTLGPREIVELTPQGAVTHRVSKALTHTAQPVPLADRIERHRARLAQVVEAHVRHFGDDVNAPLSGGIDSRLLLAALRAAGCTPRLYVYGTRDDPDVAIAEAIGAAEGFQVEWVDKENHDFVPDQFPELVESDFQQFDALPTFGNIFDDGGNTAAHDRRHAGGALAASGGCGEVYRDFFFLADRPTSAATVAKTFFARYALSDVTEAFDEQRFLGTMRDKIHDALEVPRDSGRLPRLLVEQIYPRIRCRALFGREISLEGRHGAYMMPFLDQQVVAEAMTLPMKLKQVGRFESAMLTAIDPVLARHMSDYGHHFAGPPGRKHRFNEWSTRIRPAWLRQKSYAIHRRLHPVADEHGGLVAPEYLRRVIDLDFPAMRRFFRIDRIGDSGMYRRIANLEYLAKRLGSRLVS